MEGYQRVLHASIITDSSGEFDHRLNMELDLQNFFGILYTAETPQLHPCRRIWAHIRGCYWSAKIDDISL
jgi:hypothetical protein